MRSHRAVQWILVGMVLLAIPAVSWAQVAVGISVRVGPPALPVYAQPVVPGPGYIWVPGYWAYGPGGYYWVPGTWVLPPVVGVLWTPGYWGWANGLYVWHPGYWGPHVGFYGGINYGYGYTGAGFVGGYWRNGGYYYNQSVTNVNATVIHNTYNTTVVNNNTTVNRVSYNGGTGGTTAQPTTAELAAAREPRVRPTAVQTQHERSAGMNHELLASANHGQPAVAATARPGVFKGEGVVAARSAQVGRPAPGVAQPTAGQVKSSATGAQSSGNLATGTSNSGERGANQKGVTPNAAQPQAQNQGQVQPRKGQAQPPGGQQPHQGHPEVRGGQPHPAPQPLRQEQQPHQGRPPEPREQQGGKPGPRL